jgi:hypothetical protein
VGSGAAHDDPIWSVDGVRAVADDRDGWENSPFEPFVYKMLVLPRQARGTDIGKTQKTDRG